MGFLTKLGGVVLLLAIVFLIFFGEVTYSPFTAGLDYPVYYGLFAIGAVLLVIGLFMGRRRPVYR